MSKMKKRLITSALPYVNNIPHLGNLIQVLSADVFARFCRSRGYETLYICGSDEYGTATETRAMQEGIEPKALCDRFYRIHKDIYDWFGIAFDHFGRSSCPQQTTIVQQIYRAVEASGFIERRKIEQTFCVSCERFLADRYVHGSCPQCGGSNARGDQCEDCGSMLDPTDLLEPRCGICGETPQRRGTEHLFLDLPALKDLLEAWIDEASERGRWAKNALQMTRSWIRDGLKQRCITRDLSWGVPVPDMPGKVFYVWFDAPIGYISITAELLEHRGLGAEAWKDWWLNPDEVELFQFIGKDNIPFHTVLFPGTQLASEQNNRAGGRSWTMLHHMSSSEYLNYESGKFSKTRGVGIFGNDCQDTGIPADCWRFYLYYHRPEKSDYEFTWAGFQQLVNRELIGNLGNLVNRSLSFLQRFFGGKLLTPSEMAGLAQLSEIKAFLAELRRRQDEIAEKLEWSQLKDGLYHIMEMSGFGNKIFQDKEPWILVKSDPATAHAWLTVLVYLVHDLAICLRPYLPQTAGRIVEFLGLSAAEENFAWKHLGCYERLAESLPKPQILFQQLEAKHMAQLRARFAGSQSERQSPAAGQGFAQSGEKGKNKAESRANQTNRTKEKPKSDSETWARTIDLRVGLIVEVGPHPDAERLFVEKIDCGEAEPRTIVSGLAEHYRPEDLLGKMVVVVANLKPAKLRGIKSMGMILAASAPESASDDSGGAKLEVLHPAGQPGERIVVEGFADCEPPIKRAGIEDFFAVPLLLREGKVYLKNTGAGPDLALLLGSLGKETQDGPKALCSRYLLSGDVA